MSKKVNHLQGVREQLQGCLRQAESELVDLDSQRKLKKKEVVTLRKGLKAFGVGSETPANGKIAPTLEHVNKAIRVVSNGKSRVSAERLEEKVLQVLKAQPGLSELGLKLRVQQGLARLPRDAEGYLMPPATTNQSNVSAE